MRVLVNYETLLPRSGVENCGPLRRWRRVPGKFSVRKQRCVSKFEKFVAKNSNLYPGMARDFSWFAKNFFPTFFFCTRIESILNISPFFIFITPPLSRVYYKYIIVINYSRDFWFKLLNKLRMQILIFILPVNSYKYIYIFFFFIFFLDYSQWILNNGRARFEIHFFFIYFSILWLRLSMHESPL